MNVIKGFFKAIIREIHLYLNLLFCRKENKDLYVMKKGFQDFKQEYFVLYGSNLRKGIDISVNAYQERFYRTN